MAEWPIITLSMDYDYPVGDPSFNDAKVIFTPRFTRAINENTIGIPQKDVVAVLSDGTASVGLVCTEGFPPEIKVAPFTYHVFEDFPGGMEYDIALPLSAGTEQNLSTITPTGVTTGGALVIKGDPGPPGVPGVPGAKGDKGNGVFVIPAGPVVIPPEAQDGDIIFQVMGE